MIGPRAWSKWGLSIRLGTFPSRKEGLGTWFPAYLHLLSRSILVQGRLCMRELSSLRHLLGRRPQPGLVLQLGRVLYGSLKTESAHHELLHHWHQLPEASYQLAAEGIMVERERAGGVWGTRGGKGEWAELGGTKTHQMESPPFRFTFSFLGQLPTKRLP